MYETDPKIYYAHIENSAGQKETLAHHLTRAGELCAQFLAPIGYEDWGEMLGITQDFGMYSNRFETVLDQEKTCVNHALPGAVLLTKLYAVRPVTAHLLAAAVASNHDGLKSYNCYAAAIKASWTGIDKNLDGRNREYSLFGPEEYQQAMALWRKDFTPKRNLTPAPSFQYDEDPMLSRMLFQRFLYSALIDADWSSTAEHYDPSYLEQHTGPALSPEQALKHLSELRQEKQNSSTASPNLNCLRDNLFDTCLDAGIQKPGLFSFTAPSGSGKTLAALAFAIKHCQRWHKRRIFLVHSNQSHVEQNCQDYRKVIPEMLEIRSDAPLSLDQRWDEPCIVTTYDGFFEPLFSAQAGQCRNLHQIANSVIVLHDVQHLPSHSLDATLRTIKLLCDHYGCTVLCSSAIQPSFQHRPGLEWQPREIVPEPSKLYSDARRVDWDWRLNEPTSTIRLAEELSRAPQSCVIVNRSCHASALFQVLCNLCPEDEVFYLSADLDSDQRKEVLDEVRDRLGENRPCRLVADRSAEDEADLDFPVLYRALAPLDALISSAGLCNSNGNSTMGQITVFLTEGGCLYPTEEYGRGAMCVLTLLSRHKIDCSNLSHIDEYYRLLYGYNSSDSKKLRDAIQAEDYPEAEWQYRMSND